MHDNKITIIRASGTAAAEASGSAAAAPAAATPENDDAKTLEELSKMDGENAATNAEQKAEAEAWHDVGGLFDFDLKKH